MAQVKKDPNNKTAAENRKARFAYEVLDTIETGLALTGTEVKSLRGRSCEYSGILCLGRRRRDLADQFLCPGVFAGQPLQSRAAPPAQAAVEQARDGALGPERRARRHDLVPLKIYFNDRGRAKLLLAIARGKKLHDKRETEKQRDWAREKGRLLKERG